MVNKIMRGIWENLFNAVEGFVKPSIVHVHVRICMACMHAYMHMSASENIFTADMLHDFYILKTVP